MGEQVALVTGAASGFGRGLTQALGGRGVRVLACDVDEAGGRHVAELAGALFVQLATSATPGRMPRRSRLRWRSSAASTWRF